MWKLPTIIVVVTFLSGCASTPDVTHYYYPTTSQTTISITQAVDCNAAQTKLFTSEVPQVTTTYRADYTRKPFSIRIKDLNGFFADSDFKLGRTEDGRLSSIDQSTTGQLATVIKNVVTLVASAAALGAGEKGVSKVLPECKLIAKLGGGKPVTLTYSKTVNLADSFKLNTIQLRKDEVSDGGLYTTLTQGVTFPILDVVIPTRSAISTSESQSSSDIVVQLQKMQGVELSFQETGHEFARSFAVIPTAETYNLPIPRAALFGKQSLGLTVAASGAVTSIDYGKLTGAGDATGALASILSAPATATADIVADTKAQADLIAQQQRLVRCRAKPEACQ